MQLSLWACDKLLCDCVIRGLFHRFALVERLSYRKPVTGDGSKTLKILLFVIASFTLTFALLRLILDLNFFILRILAARRAPTCRALPVKVVSTWFGRASAFIRRVAAALTLFWKSTLARVIAQLPHIFFFFRVLNLCNCWLFDLIQDWCHKFTTFYMLCKLCGDVFWANLDISIRMPRVKIIFFTLFCKPGANLILIHIDF